MAFKTPQPRGLRTLAAWFPPAFEPPLTSFHPSTCSLFPRSAVLRSSASDSSALLQCGGAPSIRGFQYSAASRHSFVRWVISSACLRIRSLIAAFRHALRSQFCTPSILLPVRHPPTFITVFRRGSVASKTGQRRIIRASAALFSPRV